MRILALHLPQFHEVTENNEWWGQGFTEWTNVKRAKPLFRGHRQPTHPLNGNYYDLSEPGSLVWQATTARDHCVDGFIFFHYWYTGKLLLEKPVELWRSTPEADLGYALCWANHAWTRAWDGKNHQVLQAQTYGGRDDWENHIQYLLSFFKDPRYILKDNKPVLFLYNPSDIPCVDEMIDYWQQRLIGEGFAGLYVVEYISSKNRSPSCSLSEAVYEDEPIYSLRFEISAFQKVRRVFTKAAKWLDFQQYDRIWKLILKKKRRYPDREIIRGAFVAWDNSPRRGKKGAMIVRGASPKKFGKYLTELLNTKRPDISQDFLVINAWNEWGEGAVLEPSCEEGFGYLDELVQSRGLTGK